jgi:hypothetical protein
VQTPARKLLLFVGSLAALALALEVLVRLDEPAFAAASNRALAKAALLDVHGPVDVLFFGTSRVQDGVSPRLFSEALGTAETGSAVAAFNLAFTSSSLNSLEELAQRYEARPGLRLAVIELSTPQLQNGVAAWELPASSESASGADVEARLTDWVHAHVRTIAHRQAFVSDNVVRLPSLLWFAADLDGSETRVTDQVAAFFGHRERMPDGFDAKAWEPVVWSPIAEVPAERVPPAPQALRYFAQREARTELVARLARLAQGYRAGGVRTLFIVPPLTKGFAPAEERDPFMKTFFAQLAKASSAPVLDYSSLVLPDEVFRGESHLNRLGRAYFSAALAGQVARSGFLKPRPVAAP